jgi:hypothetical protein
MSNRKKSAENPNQFLYSFSLSAIYRNCEGTE